MSSKQRRIVDLSHPIRHGMITYPGLPGPEIGDHLTREASREIYAAGTEFAMGRISMVSNTGTYLDSPFHRFGGGHDLAALPIERFTDLDGVVVRVQDAGGRRAVDREALLPYDVTGRAVLIHTGWDRHWGTDAYGHGHPYLTAGCRRPAGRAGRRPRRHRLPEHRRHRRRHPPRPHRSARRRHPRRGTPAGPGATAPGGLPLPCRTAGRRGHGDVPGTGVRPPRRRLDDEVSPEDAELRAMSTLTP